MTALPFQSHQLILVVGKYFLQIAAPAVAAQIPKQTENVL
jgi:hypothetical protein